jgi:hypothetical protein
MPGAVFHLEPMGRLANLMIEYMVALKFADMTGDCRISNISIPAWGIRHDPLESPGPVAVARQEQHIDLPGLAAQVESGQIRRVEWTGFGQRLENFLPPERYQEVFIGQTHANPYMDRLREAFPNAIYRQPQDDPLVDFETIRQSRHVAIGVSTYSWLAAWLSRSAETIYLTVNGLFNPMQKPQVNLLPFGDDRFRFFLFPINYAVRLEHYAEVHRRIAPYWRQVSHAALRRQFADAPRFERTLNDALAVFDEAFYLETNADVAAIATIHGPGFGRTHYINHGFAERRLPMRLDPVWYASEYPLAGFEVAQGDYAEFAHHYMAIGKDRGYLTTPMARTVAVT